MFFIICAVVILGIFIFFFSASYSGIAKAQEEAKKLAAIHSQLEKIKDFTPTDTIMGCDGIYGMSYDGQRNKICLIEKSEKLKVRVYSNHDIIECEILENYQSVTRTSRSSQIGGAIVGGILAGGVGAVAGALSGSRISSENVGSIDFKIVVNDTQKPVHTIRCLTNIINNTKINIKKESPIYQNARKNVDHWHGIVSVMIHRAD